MDRNEMINDILVNLFHEIGELEENALITGEFRDISVNDMHIIEAIGMDQPHNMSAVAKTLNVTVGTLTIAINALVKKHYVKRVRSAQDRRVVLISLDEKGMAAYNHHMTFHGEMVKAILADFTEEEVDVLLKAMEKLKGFFYQYGK